MVSFAFVGVFVVAAAAAVLGLVTLLTSPDKRANRIFAVLCGLVATFVVVNYLVDHDPGRALWWARGTFFLGCFMAWSMLAFIANFPKQLLSSDAQKWLLIMTGAFSVLCLTPAFIPSVKITYAHASVEAGPLYILFIIYMLAVFVGIGVLIRRALKPKKNNLDDRQRIKLITAGLLASAVLLVTTNILLPYINGSDASASWGPLALVVFIGISTYAIIRHKLFDVRLLIARSITYTLLLITVTTLYIAGAFSASHFLFSDNLGDYFQTLFYAGLSLVLAFTFQPLRKVFERLTDHIFYHDQYEARQVLDAISRILVSEIQLDRLMSRSLDTLCREMRLEFGQLVIFNHDRVYRIEHFGPLPKRLMVVPELRRLGTGQLVADELASGERRGLMEGHGIRVSLGLKTGDEFVGYLLLGDRLSGDPYTAADLELLAILGKELAVGISNAKAYAEIKAFNLTLQDKVEEATKRLRVANRHLTQLDKTKDEFLSMASHQLRTPLTTIKGYLSMMDEGDAGRLTATQKEFVGYAFDASERMVNLISDLLNVSRLEAGRFLIQTMPVDMVVMVEQEVRQLQSHAAGKNLSLTFVPPTEALPLAEIDENKTRQVIMNFIDNALYYTREGGVTVTLSQAGDQVRLEVTDTGIGVPEAAKKKLFGKFFRAENAQGVRPDGTGLGLYLARRVVADQGGTIIFRSSEGHGSTFGFELPFKPVKQATGKHKAA